MSTPDYDAVHAHLGCAKDYLGDAAFARSIGATEAARTFDGRAREALRAALREMGPGIRTESAVTATPTESRE